mmetsp:Transcript_23647/g.35172  ORF Transcript_23647/g.35172 Transcript_23647/m.35172 type:complete len:236 (-) Transcript_23647:68-775(-)
MRNNARVLHLLLTLAASFFTLSIAASEQRAFRSSLYSKSSSYDAARVIFGIRRGGGLLWPDEPHLQVPKLHEDEISDLLNQIHIFQRHDDDEKKPTFYMSPSATGCTPKNIVCYSLGKRFNNKAFWATLMDFAGVSIVLDDGTKHTLAERGIPVYLTENMNVTLSKEPIFPIFFCKKRMMDYWKETNPTTDPICREAKLHDIIKEMLEGSSAASEKRKVEFFPSKESMDFILKNH